MATGGMSSARAAVFAAPDLVHSDPTVAVVGGAIDRAPRGAGGAHAACDGSALTHAKHPAGQDVARPAARVKGGRLTTAPRGQLQLAAAGDDSAPSHRSAAPSRPTVGSFGTTARDTIHPGGRAAAHAPLLADEADALVRQHKPAACFGTGPARPTDLDANRVAPSPFLLPSVEAIKPRSRAATIAPPVLPEEEGAVGGARGGARTEPGPGAYEPSLALVTRRAPSVSMTPRPSGVSASSQARAPAHDVALTSSPPPPPPLPGEYDRQQAQVEEAGRAGGAPFNSTSSRVCLAAPPADERTPLCPVVDPVRPTAPAFSFGRRSAAGEEEVAWRGARALGAEAEAAEEHADTDGAYALAASDDDDEGASHATLSYALTERRAPAATFGTASRWCEPRADTPTEEEKGTPAPSTPPRPSAARAPTRGGVIGRAPRFADAARLAGLGARRLGGDAPFSPSASTDQLTELSDAATDIAPLQDVDDRATRPRAPSALMMPERLAKTRAASRRQALVDARLGPGLYSPHSTLAERRPPSAAFGASTPTTQERPRHRPSASSPGPGAYTPPPSNAPPKAVGAAWSKMSGRAEPTSQRPKVEKEAGAGSANGSRASASATAAAERGAARMASQAMVSSAQRPEPNAATTAACRGPACSFGKAPRELVLRSDRGGGRGSGDVPFYSPNHAQVERSAVGGAFARLGNSVTRRRSAQRRELHRTWRWRSAQIEALLRGEGLDDERTAAPADVLRRSPAGFAYRLPTAVSPPHQPLRTHPAVPSAVAFVGPPALHPEAAVRHVKPRPESYSFGRAAARLPPPAADTPCPTEYSVSAAEAKLSWALARVPAAIWGRLTAVRLVDSDDENGAALGGGTAAATRVRARRRRLGGGHAEGDVLLLDALRALMFVRPSLPGFRMLLPSAKPRRALVPRPPFPPPPLTPVLLLPPRGHVPTPLLGPPRHRPRPRVADWGWAEHPPATVGIDMLSLAQLAAAYTTMEPQVHGGTFAAAARFELVAAAAALLPEGCVLELHPNHDAVLPRHGVLVNMGVGQPLPRNDPRGGLAPIELLLPGPTTYEVSQALTRPAAPAIDFSRGANPRAQRSLAPYQLLEPSPLSYDAADAWAALNELSAPAWSFARSVRPVGLDADAATRTLTEGTLLVLTVGDERWPLIEEVRGGALPLDRQLGRENLQPGDPVSALGPLSAGDYEVNDAPLRHRWPAFDFGQAAPRPPLFPADPVGEGAMLDLEPSTALVLPRAPAVAFSRAEGHAGGVQPELIPEGRVLQLEPRPDAVLPSQPTVVAMRRDPNQPRRQRRWPVVRPDGERVDETHLVDIERALAVVATGGQDERAPPL